MHAQAVFEFLNRWSNMLFSSLIFIMVFLPVVFIGSRILHKNRYVNVFLLLASLFFYAWGEPVFVFVLLLSIVVNWGAGRSFSAGSCSVRRILLRRDSILRRCSPSAARLYRRMPSSSICGNTGSGWQPRSCFRSPSSRC